LVKHVEKQKLSTVKKKKKSSKKFISSVATMVVKSPGVRLIISPKVRSPVTAIRTFLTPTLVPCNYNTKRPNFSGKCNMPLF
jgi:hypothetical protein